MRKGRLTSKVTRPASKAVRAEGHGARYLRRSPYVKRTQAALSIRWKRIGSVKGMEVGTSSWRIISDGVDAYA